MKVLIQGPGAVGRLLAARLARGAESGVKTTLLDHRVERAEKLARQGIRLHEMDGTVCDVPVGAVTAAHLEPIHDLLVLCVKAFDVASAVAAGVRGLREGGSVLVTSNGLGHGSEITNHWPAERCFLATLVVGAVRDGETGVRATGSGPLRLGYRPIDGHESDQARTCQAIADVFSRSGFLTEPAADIDRAVFEKAAINCGINPTAAVLGVPNGALLESPLLSVAVGAAEEVGAVARRLGVALPTSGWEERLQQVCTSTARNRCSLLEDLQAGRRTEIDSLCGAVASLGEKNGVETPLNRTLARIVRALEGKRAQANDAVWTRN